MAKRKSGRSCPKGRVQSGPRKGLCRKKRHARRVLHAGPLRPGERRRSSFTKSCKNGPVIQRGPRAGLCPKRPR